MSTLLIATLLLFLLWPAYAFLLRVSDRYGLNRFLLLLVMVAVCALPFVSLPSPAPVATQSVRGTVAYLEESVRPSVAVVSEDQAVYHSDAKGEMFEEVPAEATSVDLLPLVYGIGLGIMLLVLGIRLLLIFTLHLRSRLNKEDTYRLLHPGASPGQAFTFGRNLYFSEDVPQDADFRHILDHERVHAHQGHTLDILLSEFFLCVFWFHPAAWWLRTQTRANLEYLVDRAVVSGGADRRDYQLALVRQSQGAYGLALALPFSEPTLKSRIARMTGLPEYRVVALLAAVALVFWLGVTLLVVNGTIFDDEPPVGKEYLEAAAHPGDPYYEHYQRTLPEELTSLEIYTNRMITVDEYLQLRAILGKVPGAKLYVYKNRFDEGYSLELRYGFHEDAVINRLQPEGSERYAYMIGMEHRGEPGQYSPTAVYMDAEHQALNRKASQMMFHITAVQPNFSLNLFDTKPSELSDELQVYVNRKKVDLVKQPNYGVSINGANENISVRLNGTQISAFGADDWPQVPVEGRKQPDNDARMMALLSTFKTKRKKNDLTISRFRVKEGTYRKWYEELGYHEDELVITRYNDRRVSLDFLLDTEFGNNAMIQHGVIYGKNRNRYALQVIDDVPVTDQSFLSGGVTLLDQDNKRVNTSPSDSGRPDRIDLFFRRLPTPREVSQISGFLSGFPEIDLRVFQSCENKAGDYTLHLGNSSGTKAGSAVLAVGEAYDSPLRFTLKRDKLGEATIKTYQSGQAPPQTKPTEIYLVIDGVYITIRQDTKVLYSKETLDPVPDATAIQCKLSGVMKLSTFGNIPLIKFWANQSPPFWMYTYKATHPGMLEGFYARLVEEGFDDRLVLYFINNEVVTDDDFDQYQGGEGSYVRMGTWSNIDDAPVILEIVD